jgi:quercetin dioxygenase-like cupin family protein
VVRKGDILYNPVSGETFTFLKTSADTNGKLLQMDVSLAPECSQLPSSVHIHPKQQETLRIRYGQLRTTINNEEKVYGPGSTILIPKGVPHCWSNESKIEELHLIWELTPALQTETILETLAALSQAGKLSRNSPISFFQLALILNKFPNHILLAGSPGWLQRLGFMLAAPLAMIAGYTAELNYKEVVKNKNIPLLAQR